MRKKSPKREIIKLSRRNFLKFLGICGGALLLSKFLGSSLGLFSDSKSQKETRKETNFQNFRVVETKDELTFYGQNGEAILIIDKKSF